MNPEDPLSRVLHIDLTRKKFWIEERRELFERWLGGIGVAIQLFKETREAEADPLAPGNPIVFAVGPLTSLYPLASKTVAVFRSPLTGNLGESHAGGRSASAIRVAGYGAIVIRGASEKPIYLIINERGVHFKDGSTLWGVASAVTVGRILREAAPGEGVRTIMRIGRAGERLVRFSSVMTETFRHFGRLGLGAAFGSKKLKAIIIYGRRKIPVADKRGYREIYDKLYETAVKSELMKKYHDLGTALNILPLNTAGALPTRNLTSVRFEGAEEISGENIIEKRAARRAACAHCPTACIHIAALREPYPDEPYFHKTTFISYDYELLYSLGSMLGVKELDGVLKLIDLVEILGLDAISTGVCLAWATEAYKRKLIGVKETLVKLEWGETNVYLTAIRNLVEQPNEFYSTLAQGVAEASRHYGGEEFALHFGGNEMPGYHTGYASAIGHLIGSRHSHLDAAGYRIDERLEKIPEPEELVEMLLREEKWRQTQNSLVICLFSRAIYSPETVSEALKPLGYHYTEEELKKLGEEIYWEKQALKISLGFNPTSLKPPRRIFEVPTPHGTLNPEYVEKALKHYQELVKNYE